MSDAQVMAGAAPAVIRGTSGHHRVLVIGGGTAGITVAARLRRAGQEDVALIEPSDLHYYQPLWTLVGAGIADARETVRPMLAVMPAGVHWIRGRAEVIDPVSRRVALADGRRIGYDFLIVAPGIQIDWNAIPGLVDALRTDHVASVYDVRYAQRMARMVERFRGGTALFTSTSSPVKCGGAPQKIMYVSSDTWRRSGVLKDAHVIFGNAGRVIFAVQPFRDVLTGVVERYGIDVRHQHDLIEVRPRTREAVFARTEEPGGEPVTIGYDLLHVTPRMSAPDFLKNGPLAADDPLGWVAIDKHTMQHPRYPEIFSLGDACNAPTARTGAAIRKQAPVVVENLRAVMAGREPTAKYDGYSSCPLLTARNRMLLAEFDYDQQPAPSIPFLNTFKERYSMYLLKRYGLPLLYWHGMLKGRA